ncbi:hypothetical protein [Streptomyces rugosispiralis]|uniref:Uncharacterized protein n=1 Tax=Streptomyces rugosispiralis TaxID=2967341 RepID=A0ABT1UY92_9ACTN|nr:hypothetical protein [Streptomyces rugosispiralis]MCQ8190092.1 hypothetical protein [Streptomyces rugosispiralis]
MTAVLEVLLWWAALTGLWLVLISTVDPLELLVGSASALAAALLARVGRRAVADR